MMRFDYLTKYFKSIASAVSVVSISLIVLQKVIPCHKNKINNLRMVASGPFCRHFSSDRSQNPRDTSIPVCCQGLTGRVNQGLVKLQAASHPLPTSVALQYVTACQERQTAYAAVSALNASCVAAKPSKALSGCSASSGHSLTSLIFLS